MESFDSHLGRLLNLEMPDIGVRRPHAQLTLEAFQVISRTDRHDFHTAVVQITRPASNPKLTSRMLGEIAVPHPLNTAGDVVPAR